jgi:retron-type reverse transcriptase
LGYAGKTCPKPDGKTQSATSRKIERYGERLLASPTTNGDNRFRNVGLPKGGDSYGNGAFVVCGIPPTLLANRWRDHTKGKQRFFSTKANAVGSKTDGISSLEELRLSNSTTAQHVYKILTDENIYIAAYEQIKSKPGYITNARYAQFVFQGVGKMSGLMDDMSKEKLKAIAEELRTEKYQCQPIRSRTFKPTKDGRLLSKPIGMARIPSIKDKLVQTVMVWILEAIYEKTFKNINHGYKPGRGYYTTLKQIRQWNGCTCVITGNIKNYLNQIDHHKLANILSRRIKDQQFIDLYWKIVRAGYLYENELEERPSEKDVLLPTAVDGGSLPSTLSNIYFHELDEFMKKLIEETGSANNLEYVQKKSKLRSIKDPEQRKNESNNEEPTQRGEITWTGARLRWARYMNHWIVGVAGDAGTGDRAEYQPSYARRGRGSEQIKEKIKEFLKEQLGLELLEIKITHIRNEKAQFLGVRIGCSGPRKAGKARIEKKTTTGLIEKRVNHVRIRLEVPRKEIITKLIEAGFLRKEGKKYYIQAISKWISLDHKDILYRYNAIIRGYLNYYSFVDNRKTLRGVARYILRHSCAKTLARKFRLKNRKGAFQKFGKNLGTPGGEAELAIPKNFKSGFIKSVMGERKQNHKDRV